MTERKLVIVKDGGILPELGGICGPIPNPTRIPVKKIIDMIVHNRTVFECDPADPRNEEKRVKLTLVNVKQDNFCSNASKSEEKKEEVPETPKKEEPKKEEVKPEEKKEAAPVKEPVKEEPKKEAPVEEPAPAEKTEEAKEEVKPEEAASVAKEAQQKKDSKKKK